MVPFRHIISLLCFIESQRMMVGELLLAAGLQYRVPVPYTLQFFHPPVSMGTRRPPGRRGIGGNNFYVPFAALFIQDVIHRADQGDTARNHEIISSLPGSSVPITVDGTWIGKTLLVPCWTLCEDLPLVRSKILPES